VWLLGRDCVLYLGDDVSIPSDWHSKAEANAARIRETFSKENVDVVVNAD
jgi:hypothetical protein